MPYSSYVHVLKLVESWRNRFRTVNLPHLISFGFLLLLIRKELRPETLHGYSPSDMLPNPQSCTPRDRHTLLHLLYNVDSSQYEYVQRVMLLMDDDTTTPCILAVSFPYEYALRTVYHLEDIENKRTILKRLEEKPPSQRSTTVIGRSVNGQTEAAKADHIHPRRLYQAAGDFQHCLTNLMALEKDDTTEPSARSPPLGA